MQLTDIANQPGQHLIVLLTDGEETCNGDAAAVIRELTAAGNDVRVNIVGFAIDELMLQETFAEWSRLGNGFYFNARDGAELAASLRGWLPRARSTARPWRSTRAPTVWSLGAIRNGRSTR